MTTTSTHTIASPVTDLAYPKRSVYDGQTLHPAPSPTSRQASRLRVLVTLLLTGAATAAAGRTAPRPLLTPSGATIWC
jgi:hypothetical protein